MATVTPNFNWPVPTSTDLVKDGATAIEALGDSIDASLVDLKGGTTGQVLSKTTNTDMDFTWVTTDDANAIQNSIVDAKGDLISATANDTPARLAVGANGETLVADSSTSTGLRYQSAYNGNAIINGSQDIWQRGTSVANTATYVYAQDRYRMGGATAQTTTRQAVNDTTNLPTIQYCARMQRNSGSTATTDIVLGYSGESADSYRFAGQTVTFSFYARAGANYSAASSAFRAVVTSGTGTDQNILSGYTGAATVINATPTLTTTWQRFSYTGTVAATVTEIGHTFFYVPVGTAGANDYAEVTGVQLELGSVATTFKRSAGGSIQGELAACTYYFERLAAESASNGAATFAYGLATSTTAVNAQLRGFARKRVAPSITFSGNTDFRVFDQVTATATTAMAATAASYMDPQGFGIVTITATVASGLTQYRPYFVIPAGGSGLRFIDISAEL